MTIENMDVLEWAKSYSGKPFHAMLTDPPYHLTSIKGSKPARYGKEGVSSKGFMNQQWDGGDIAFRPETWEELTRHLYPGAFGMSFASSRGWHRLACAIEDAGMIIHPSIFLWSYSQGFPKATNIMSQLDDNWATKNYGGWCDCDDVCNTP